MDSITQAALGAAIGEAMFGKKIGSKGALLGAAVATIPDLDVLLLPFYSEVEKISIHRGYSHSILFIIGGAILLALVLKSISWFKDISLRKLLLFNWLALITHVLLDVFTSYGTQLFLPFSTKRIGLDSINIVDPFYTIPLLVGLFLSVHFYKNHINRHFYNKIGILLSSIYLVATLFIKNYANHQFINELRINEIKYQSLLTIPVGFGGNNWYGVARTVGGLYIGKYSTYQGNQINFEYYPSNDFLLDDVDSELVKILKWFAKDYYVVAKVNNKIRFYNLQCDMQGSRFVGGIKVPTAFYFEIIPYEGGSYKLTTGMHSKESKK